MSSSSQLSLPVRGCCIALLSIVAASDLGSQGLVRIRGLAYDSLHATPLSGAFIGITGTSRTAVSDSAGRFTFDSIAPGTYRFVMQHDVLDSIGMSGAAARATITTGNELVVIAVPSFTTLWNAVCPSPFAPTDSALVFGRLQLKASQRPPANAVVRATWLDVGFDRTTGVTQQRWHRDAHADSAGNYALCGLPIETGIRLQGATDSAASPVFDLPALTGNRVARRDLTLGAIADLGPSNRGDIAGVVTGENRAPVPDARVTVAGMSEARTDGQGRFTVRGVPAGTQQVEVRALGMSSTTAAVDVSVNDTKLVEIQLAKVTVLDSVVVVASKARQQLLDEINARVKTGAGIYRDSTDVSRKPELLSAFRDMPTVNVSDVRDPHGMRHIQIQLPGTNAAKGGCVPPLWIDGKKEFNDPTTSRPDHSELLNIRPEDILRIEVYPRALSAPPQYVSGGYDLVQCGVILVWTKRILP